MHGGAVKKVESFDKYRNAQLKKLEGPPPWINDFGTHRSLTRRNIPMPARTRRQILVERDEETNQPLFARQKTDELSRLTIKNIGQIVMKDHMKI